MHLPADFPTWLKAIGSISSGFGSMILAWRASKILKWVVYCLVSHEQSIQQLIKIIRNEQQTEKIIIGTAKHLIDIESKIGLYLLVLGLVLLGLGMFSNAASFFV